MPARSRPVPTLATVAAEAGVSRQTVSNALNNPELLRPDTLKKVLATIERLGYSPNRAARNLRTRASHLIGLRLDPTIPGSVSALMDRFLHSLVEASKHAGYHVLLFTADDANDPLDGYDELMRSAAVDAFIVTDTYRGNPQAAWLEDRGIPFVSFGRPWEDPSAPHPWVDVDGGAGIAMAVDHVVERGHSRIAWIGWQRGSFIGEDRRSGWLQRMHHHGLSTTRMSARGEDTVDFGRRAAHAMFDSEDPTAFVCASDTLAMGVMAALADRGLKPGRYDISVTGFDDSLAAQVVPPGLTSVRQPLGQIAVEIIRLLDARLSHRTPEQNGVILEPTLALRGTT